MKKALFAFVLATVAAIFYQCTDKTAGTKRFSVINVDLSKVSDTLDMSDILSDSVLFVPLEYVDDERLLGEISDVVYTPGFIGIRDDLANRFHIFDHSGSHITTISRQGRGPGEYVNITSAAIVGDSLVFIYDMMSRKLLTYDINGNFNKGFDASDIWCNELLSYNGELIAINHHSKTNSGFYSAFLIDPETGVTKKCMAPFDEKFYSEGLGWSLSRYSTQDNDRLFFNLPPYDTIYTITPNGCEPSYFVNFNESKIPSSVINTGGENSLTHSIKTGLVLGVKSLMVINNTMLLGFNYKGKYHLTAYNMQTGQTDTYANLKNKYLPGYLVESIISSQNSLITWMDTQWLRLIYSENYINSNKKYNESYFNRISSYLDTVRNDNYVIIIQKGR